MTSSELGHGSHDGILRYSRFDRPRSMAPRQLDSWSARIAVVSGISRVSGASAHIGVGFSGAEIEVSAAVPVEGHKLLVLTGSGETLESPLSLEEPGVRRYPLPEGLNPRALAILSASREELLRVEVDARPSEVVGGLSEPDEALQTFADPEGEILDAFAWHNRALAENLLGLRALARGDFGEAEVRFEQSLLTTRKTIWFGGTRRLRLAWGV